mgnify:CR=1 FL=1
MPEISVIVPVYKAEAYLHACIDSILSQTASDFELILVDDGSGDGSWRVIESLHGIAACGLPLEVWESEANFVLVRMPNATRVRERMRDEKSILVRDFSYAPGLANCLRITVGTPEENDEVLAALAALLKEEIDSCHE